MSLGEIAKNAGVGRATLHRHFSKKEELVLAIQKQSMTDTNEAVVNKLEDNMTALEQLEAMFSAIIPLGNRFHFLSTQITADDEVRAQYASQLKWLAQLVDDLKQEGVVSESMPSRWAVAQLDQLIWTAWGEVASGFLAAADAAALALRTFTHGAQA